MLITFSLTVFAWIFFRSESLPHAFSIINRILISSNGVDPIEIFNFNPIKFILLKIFLIIFLSFEWIHREKEYGLEISRISRLFAWPIYITIFLVILLFGGQEQSFIYFQF